MGSKRKIRIGFDLDGVVINKPFFVPHTVIDFLIKQRQDHKLGYRYPNSLFERLIRITSHHPLLRSPIRKNIDFIRKIHESNNYELYVVSSRYSFLENRTKEWFSFYKMRRFFKKIHINTGNEQPHLYKEKMIKQLNLNIFIDDDLDLIKYLKRRLKNVKVYYADENGIKWNG